jgi:Ca2+-transporting ATPase
MLKQFTDFIILVLVAAAIVSAAIEDYEAMIVLFVVVIINGIIGFVQEYRAKKALDALNSLSVPKAQILRNTVPAIIDSVELVPGDIVLLDEGQNVPADIRLIECSQLSIIEALLTGEPIAVTKNPAVLKGRRNLAIGDRINMAFMSTMVAKGRGVGVVVNTGIGTQVGRIVSSIRSAQHHTTPLQQKLTVLGKWLVLISAIACGAVVGIGLGRGYGSEIIKTGIALAVSVIPEGLVTVVTLTMALGMQVNKNHEILNICVCILKKYFSYLFICLFLFFLAYGQ